MGGRWWGRWKSGCRWGGGAKRINFLKSTCARGGGEKKKKLWGEKKERLEKIFLRLFKTVVTKSSRNACRLSGHEGWGKQRKRKDGGDGKDLNCLKEGHEWYISVEEMIAKPGRASWYLLSRELAWESCHRSCNGRGRYLLDNRGW